MLVSQVSHGVRWQLNASIGEDGLLCMSVDGPKGPDTDTPWSSGGCGFDSSPSGGHYMAGPGPGAGDADIMYGPLPEAATDVRVTSGKVVGSHSFPAGSGLPAGRYWYSFDPSEDTDPDTGRTADPQPLDAAGDEVAFTDF
ncbi:hypothetical protein AAFN69_13970 [Streptomyces sp. CAU 1734]